MQALDIHRMQEVKKSLFSRKKITGMFYVIHSTLAEAGSLIHFLPCCLQLLWILCPSPQSSQMLAHILHHDYRQAEHFQANLGKR